MQTEIQRKANNALGVFVVALVFLFETWVAHRSRPSPASPYVWGILGLVAVAALALFVYFRAKARAEQR
jgi:drug/metabolite transporter (DMT)-like permease